MNTKHVPKTILPRRVSEDLRPPLECYGDVSDWLQRRFINVAWVEDLLLRMSQVLKMDADRHLLSEPRAFGRENHGISIIGPSRAGKTTLTLHVVERYLDEQFSGDHDDRGKRVVYYRVKGDATVKAMCLDICALCGFPSTPKQITRHDAQALAAHVLRRANISVLIIDEVHNSLKRSNEPVDLMLKGLLQDTHGLTVIAIGTERLGEYLRRPENNEVIGRFLEVSLVPFEHGSFCKVVMAALKNYSDAVDLPLAADISDDPHFAARIITGCQRSHGLCMRLIASTVIYAHENEFAAVSKSDFQHIYRIQFAHLEGSNPFEPEDFSALAVAPSAAAAKGSLLLSHLNQGTDTATALTKRRRQRTKKATG